MADTELYLGTLEGYSWNLDDQDTNWTPWGLITTRPEAPLVFQAPGLHVLNVRARDAAGIITLGSVIIEVVGFPFDRNVLLVDDSFDDTYPRDNQNDVFWQDRFDAYGETVLSFDPYGALDREFLTPRTPPLSEMSRYRLLVWDLRGTGYNGVTSLSTLLPAGALQAYLRAGGQLWLSGRTTLAAVTGGSQDPTHRGDFVYPKLGLGPGDFAWDFLKLRSTRIDNDRGAGLRNNLLEAKPFPGRPELYPHLEVDPDKQNLIQRGLGIGQGDAVFDPLLVDQEPGFRGVLDSLYVYGATGDLVQDNPSPFHQKLTGLRWHDPDPDRAHGRIQWFGFPMYYMVDSQAQEVFNRSLDWFREESPGEASP